MINASIITEWVLIVFTNTWISEVDTFAKKDICEQRAQIFMEQHRKSQDLAWCELRPISKLPAVLKND